MTDPEHAAFKPVLADSLVELAHIIVAALRITRQNRHHILVALLFQLGHGVDQHQLAFPIGQACRQQHHPLVRLDVPGAPQTVDPLRLDRGRGKHLQIGAAMDHPQPRIINPVGLLDQSCGIMRVGNHRIAAHHHRIIEAFDRRLARIAAVIGRDKRNTENPRRRQRTPRRSPRTGMDQLDPFGAAQIAQTENIQRHGHRIFGFDRQQHRNTAFGLQFRHQPTALTGHQRARAYSGKPCRNVNGCAFSTTGIKLGNHLENRSATQRRGAGTGKTG